MQEAIAFLRGSAADRLPHGRGRNLLQHLVGTHAILRAWMQPKWLQYAGLYHSVYSTDVYRRALIPLPSGRGVLRSVVGRRAEHVVYLFCVVSRRDFFGRLRDHATIPAIGIDAEMHGGGRLSVAPDEVAHLLLLHLANEAEQVCEPDGSPASWLARWSRRTLLLRDAPMPVPPVFDRCTATVSTVEERTALNAYRMGLSHLFEDPYAAESELRNAIAACPWVAEPFVLLAWLLQRRGATPEARALAHRAEALAMGWASAWDKRLSLAQWMAVIASILSADARSACDGSPPNAVLAALTRTCERVPAS